MVLENPLRTANSPLDNIFVSPLVLFKCLKVHDWLFLVCLGLLAATGTLLLYSAGGGDWSPWASDHLSRFAISFSAMIAIACIHTRLILQHAYSSYLLFVIALLAVEFFGQVGMGAQRWLNIAGVTIQPSEFMKIGLVLALARYYHFLPREQAEATLYTIPALILIVVPAAMVFMQPNLGTSTLLVTTGLALAFSAGLPLWLIFTGGAGVAIALPVLWANMYDYQKSRVLTFLDPERDPLGQGYNIIQSKIALGSGGIIGKGFLHGTQSQLGFLPEKQTDFIFVVLAEEWGLIGAFGLLLVCSYIVVYGFIIAFRTRFLFGKFCAIGLGTSFFLYVFVNLAMVMGMIPVVGIPLPLVSYGGTVMLAVMVSAGVMLNISLREDIQGRSLDPFGK